MAGRREPRSRPKAATRQPPTKRAPRAHHARADAAHPLPAALRRLPMLEFMSPEVRRFVAESFTPMSFPFGAVVVREGDPADALYVVAGGRARAIKRGESDEEVPLGILKPGDTFGELALLEHSTRAATVRASSELEVLRLDRGIFHAMLEQHPEMRRSFEMHVRRIHLVDFFRLHTAFSRLPPDAMAVLLRELDETRIEAGEIVVTQGERSGPMYIVREGRLRAFRSDDGAQRELAYLRSGDFFGELSLFKGAARDATVEAMTPAVLLRLARRTFTKLLRASSEFREQIEERVAQYDYRSVARLPLDFAEEVVASDLCTTSPESAPFAETERSVDPAVEGDEAFPVSPRAPGGRRARRFPFVWQIDEMDCGAACLAMIVRHFGRAVSIGHVRQAVETGVDGTSLLGIVQGASALGLEAHPIKASKSRLDELPLPAVVHWEGNHWVVLHDVDRRRVRVADPARGLRKVDRAEFLGRWSGYAALVAPTPALAETPEGRAGIGWIWRFLRPHRSTIVGAVLLALAAAALSMVFPIFTQVVVDRVVARGDAGLLDAIILGMVGALVVMLLASIGQRYLLARAAVQIDGSTLDFITGRLLALPMRYFHTRRTGDVVRRLAGVRQAREFLVFEGVNAITAAAQLGTALVLMLIYSWRLALVYLAVAPAYLGLMRFSSKRLRPMFDSLEEAFGKYTSQQIDAIRGIETVKALAAESTLQQRMLTQFQALARRLFRADFTIMVYGGAVQLATFVALALFLWAGAHQVLDDRMTLGELVSFNALVLLANAPLAQLLSVWDEFQLTSVLLNRLNDVFEQEPEQGADHAGLRSVPTLEGRIRFAGVGFRYPGAGAAVLSDVSFEVRPGATVAIVGRSGSGKTTLMKCLAGLIEPTSGTILYDHFDLRTLDYRDLRRQIGFVLQENYLFDDTIARNVALGHAQPDMERVRWAADTADALEFVERLPLGFETKVGESGLLLSGGQRQRLAIARALYQRPPVLILDEATSSLDTEAERAVQANLVALAEGRTTFVIAHRLSTVRDADTIVVLERGRVVEQGAHDELMSRRGLYYYLVSQQLGL